MKIWKNEKNILPYKELTYLICEQFRSDFFKVKMSVLYTGLYFFVFFKFSFLQKKYCFDRKIKPYVLIFSPQV